MKNLYIGTCSWKYPSWEGLVYSRAKNINYLEEYAGHYDSVEIDQWFWSLFPGHPPKLPAATAVADYRAAVGDDFRFTVKAPNALSLTHYYKHLTGGKERENPYFLDPALYREFIDSLGALAPQIGAVMLQFEYLNKRKMASSRHFLEKIDAFLKAVPREIPLALEVRNPNYLNTAFFAFLKERNLGQVFLQGYYMPSVIGLIDRYLEELPDWLVIRLHGGDRKGIEERSGGIWNKVIDARDDELADVVERIGSIQRRGILTYLNVNNHYEGSAPLTISRIENLLHP